MKDPENDRIPEAHRLLTTLLEEIIPQAQALKGKWALIRARLAQLQAHLTDLSRLPASATNVLSLDLLAGISVTLTDAASLAGKCRSPDFIRLEGKLRAQSDVDSVLARVEAHARDAGVLIASGVLVGGDRSESRSLIARVQIGAAESRSSALEELVALLLEDDKNVAVAVGQGVVPVLVRAMDSTEPAAAKERVVAAISRVAAVESGRHALSAEGGVFLLNHLLRVLESGSGYAREKACFALLALSSSKDNARAIGSRGGVSSLLETCLSGTPGSRAYAAGVLKNVAVFSEGRENLVEEGAVSVLVRVAGSGTVAAQENSFGCLCNLVREEEELKVAVFKEGVVECLRNYWDSDPELTSLESAIELVGLLSTREGIAEVLVNDGWVGRVSGVLSCGVMSVRIAGARAVYELGFHSAQTRKEMGILGCIEQLVSMLEGKAVEEREASVRALSVLVLCSENRRLLRKDGRGVVCTVHLLDPSIEGLDLRYPVEVLLSLLHSRKSRKEMVAAGACLHLKKLVEMDVDGAKKLLDGIGKGKIWGVFSRP